MKNNIQRGGPARGKAGVARHLPFPAGRPAYFIIPASQILAATPTNVASRAPASV